MKVPGWARRALPSPQALRQVSLLAGGTAMGQGVVVAASPLLSRLFTPEAFGILAVYSSLLSIILVVSSLRLHMAVPLPVSDDDALALVALAFLAIAVVTTTLAGVLYVLPNALTFEDAVTFPSLRWALPLGVLAGGAYLVLSHWAIRRRAFGVLARTKVVQALTMTAIQIVAGVLGAGALALVAGDVAGRSAGIGSLAASAGLGRGRRLKGLRPRMLRNLRRYWRFPVISTGSALMNSAGLHLPGLLIVALHGAAAGGAYALANRVIGVPMNLVGTSVGQVYLSRLPEYVRGPRERAVAALWRTVTRLALVGAPFAVVLALGGPLIFRQVFGASWAEAGEVARILAVLFLVRFTVVPVSQTLVAAERLDIQLQWDAFRLVLVGAVFGTAWWVDAGLLPTLAAFAFVMVIAYVVLFGACLRALGSKRAGA